MRNLVTARVLDFRAGAEELQVGRDLAPASIEGAPESLRHITNAVSRTSNRAAGLGPDPRRPGRQRRADSTTSATA